MALVFLLGRRFSNVVEFQFVDSSEAALPPQSFPVSQTISLGDHWAKAAVAICSDWELSLTVPQQDTTPVISSVETVVSFDFLECMKHLSTITGSA